MLCAPNHALAAFHCVVPESSLCVGDDLSSHDGLIGCVTASLTACSPTTHSAEHTADTRGAMWTGPACN